MSKTSRKVSNSRIVTGSCHPTVPNIARRTPESEPPDLEKSTYLSGERDGKKDREVLHTPICSPIVRKNGEFSIPAHEQNRAGWGLNWGLLRIFSEIRPGHRGGGLCSVWFQFRFSVTRMCAVSQLCAHIAGKGLRNTGIRANTFALLRTKSCQRRPQDAHSCACSGEGRAPRLAAVPGGKSSEIARLWASGLSLRGHWEATAIRSIFLAVPGAFTTPPRRKTPSSDPRRQFLVLSVALLARSASARPPGVHRCHPYVHHVR